MHITLLHFGLVLCGRCLLFIYFLYYLFKLSVQLLSHKLNYTQNHSEMESYAQKHLHLVCQHTLRQFQLTKIEN